MRIVLCLPICVFSVGSFTKFDSESLTDEPKMVRCKMRNTIWFSWISFKIGEHSRVSMLHSFPKVHGWSLVDKNSLSTIGYRFAARGDFFSFYLWESVLYLRRTKTILLFKKLIFDNDFESYFCLLSEKGPRSPVEHGLSFSELSR